jgi:hypothetical protein
MADNEIVIALSIEPKYVIPGLPLFAGESRGGLRESNHNSKRAIIHQFFKEEIVRGL